MKWSVSNVIELVDIRTRSDESVHHSEMTFGGGEMQGSSALFICCRDVNAFSHQPIDDSGELFIKQRQNNKPEEPCRDLPVDFIRISGLDCFPKPLDFELIFGRESGRRISTRLKTTSTTLLNPADFALQSPLQKVRKVCKAIEWYIMSTTTLVELK